MRRNGLINKISSKKVVSGKKSMQVLDEQSKAYFNFINSLNTESTRKSYTFCIEKFLGHYEIDLVRFLNLPHDEMTDLIIRYFVDKKISKQYKNLMNATLKHACEINDVFLNPLKPYVRYVLPILFILATVHVAFVIAKIRGDRFSQWVSWRKLDAIQIDIIQMDAAIIAGLFILLGFAFQTEAFNTPHGLFPTIDVRSWIIGITSPTVFPFVASLMLLFIFGLAPGTWHDYKTGRDIPVSQWPSQMGSLFMLLGFVWIMIDIIAILLLLG